jgi:Leucine-rich repeat (LRR) protein
MFKRAAGGKNVRATIGLTALILMFMTATTISPFPAGRTAGGQMIERYQSTTGPVPPPGVNTRGYILSAAQLAEATVIPGVPQYAWRRGCGPTSVGMVLGYYDTHGFSGLIPGDASTQTTEVDTAISSQGNWDDYCLPMDDWPNPVLPDRSELPAGDEHANDSVADFMRTSWSINNHNYGWGFDSYVTAGFVNWASLRGVGTGSSSVYYFSSFSWTSLKSEIDNRRPLVFLVDTDADGFTDHFVTVVGYNSSGQYGCYNTWNDGVRWYDYEEMDAGVSWGVSKVHTFQIAALNPGSLQVTLTPAAAVAAGVQWNVDDGPWRNSGETVSGLSPEGHIVRYKAVEGWAAPSNETVTISTGVTTQLTRSFQEVVMVVSPNGGESLTPGSAYPITWSQFEGPVKIEYSIDNGVTWTPILEQIAVLSVTPPDGFISSGPEGGPFTPASKDYTLQNTGNWPLNWQGESGALTTLSATSGALAAGASTTVTASIDSIANGYTPGTYNDTVVFLNVTNGIGQTTRPVTLTVTPQHMPDLIISDLMGTLNASGGSFTAIVRNIGDAAAADSVLRMTLRRSTTTIATQDFGVPALSPGATFTQKYDIEVAVPSGTYTLTARADATGVVAEWNETNNTASITKTVPLSPWPESAVESWLHGPVIPMTDDPIILIETASDGGEIQAAPNAGPWTFNWTVPSVNSSQCLIRVSDARDGVPVDTSDAVFTIGTVVVPTITVISPNGGESWEEYSSQAITWTSSGGVGNVNVDYSTDGGSSWTAITVSTANDGSCPWTPYPPTSATCLVRVSETDGSPADTSDALFSIIPRPTITVLTPTGGEVLRVGSVFEITWTSTGTVGNVALEYEVGTAWTTFESSTENDGTYSWTVPNMPTTQSRIMVREVDGQPYDTSAYFSIVAAVPSFERQALIELYNSTNGDAWTNKSGWKTPPLAPDGFALPGTEGTWHGVTVSEAFNVVQIDLTGNNLVGALPPSLGNLTSLWKLYLTTNQLSGQIPPELGNLVDLHYLHLNQNQLSGPIPASLGGLTMLWYLRLNVNQLTGPIPPELGGLPNLLDLSLNGNELTGPIPPQLGNLAHLYTLDLAGNQLTGSIPAELGSLSALNVLYLDSNQLNGQIPPELGNLASLHWLYLNDNQLSGAIPPQLGNLSALQYLNLARNQLSGPIPPELGDLSSLLDLFLSANQLSGEIPAEIGDLFLLEDLALNSNQLSGPIPASLGNLSHLSQLYLHANQLNGPIPSELGDLSSLQYLYLYSNLLTGEIPSELGDLSGLLQLYLYSNQLSGPIPASLGGLAALQYLYLNSNQLTGSIPSEFGNLAGLKNLFLNNNQLIGSIPASLGSLVNLQWLNFYSNQLTGLIPPELGNLAALQNLYLNANQLTGSIPPELGTLGQLRRLYLNNNQLSGPIPAALGNLSNLQYLNLSANQLSGSIPPEMGNLTALYGLYLSSNQLSGSIPAELGGMNGLNALYLGNNQLDGTIPAQLGDLANLRYLSLELNDLSGSIPPEIASLSQLLMLTLYSNHFSGTIPAELGSLVGLLLLQLNGNQLAGPIPSSLTGLINLGASSLDIGYNALTASDPDLITFLSAKDPDWASTQTVAPTNAAAAPVGGTTALVSWTPIAYQGNSGGYIVSVSMTSGGPYIVAGQTATKSDASMTVTGLAPGTPYYFVVRTHTDAHALNPNAVDSGNSGEVAAATLAQLLVRGRVLRGGTPFFGVVMSGLPGSPTTDPSGAYQGLVNVGWSGTVSPTLADYAFTPPNRIYAGVAFDQLSQDYEGELLIEAITVSSPNGGEQWVEGTPQTLTWNTVGTIPTVCIQFSANGGADWSYVVQETANTGSYPWTVPHNPQLQCLIKISDSIDGLPSDTSDAVFSIVSDAVRKDDFVGTWDGQGVYYRNSDTAGWVKMASPATKITVGDLDGDEIDDLIGLWPTQGGIWAKYSQTGAWAKLSSTARYIAAGDMNGDGRIDLVGTWDGQGVFYRNSITGAWIKMASPATMVTAGDIDNDGTDDLIGLWPSQGGIWVKYSSSGSWARMSSTAAHIAAGDMNGDGWDDLLGTWDGQGVFYRDSATGQWVALASPATLITTGDIDGDAIDDLIGIWPTQGGVWVRYSSDNTWQRLSSTAGDIAAGKMRAASGGGTSPSPDALAAEQISADLLMPLGGNAEGPEAASQKRDLSDRGPGGARFVYLEDINLEPKEDHSARLARVPGPGEAGFAWQGQANVYPGEVNSRKRSASVKQEKIQK